MFTVIEVSSLVRKREVTDDRTGIRVRRHPVQQTPHVRLLGHSVSSPYFCWPEALDNIRQIFGFTTSSTHFALESRKDAGPNRLRADDVLLQVIGR